jgi:HD-GYP domain-containing protein (c-di-GMP phosphodiesterase class II)
VLRNILLETIIQEDTVKAGPLVPFTSGDLKIPLLTDDKKPQSVLPVDPDDSQVVWNLRRVFEDAVRAMGQMMEVRDPYTAGHQSRVSQICVEIARMMKLSSFQIKGVELAALVHDVGKLAIPSEILSKPGRLSSLEFDLIKTHPQVGYDIMKSIEFPWPVASAILQHHERMDGSGYPNGLQDKEILLEARILGVADVIEAMSSNRPYRPALGICLALEEICKNKHKLYDGAVVDASLEYFATSQDCENFKY